MLCRIPRKARARVRRKKLVQSALESSETGESDGGTNSFLRHFCADLISHQMWQKQCNFQNLWHFGLSAVAEGAESKINPKLSKVFQTISSISFRFCKISEKVSESEKNAGKCMKYSEKF